jgi:ABC-type methionine transport system ATPase subunit
VRDLRDLFGLTIVMITHDLDLLWQVADRVAVLADGKVQGIGSMAELAQWTTRRSANSSTGRAAERRRKKCRPQSQAQPHSHPANPTREAIIETKVNYTLVGGFRPAPWRAAGRRWCSGSPRAAPSRNRTTCTWLLKTNRWPASI